jgi:hypothetical protein
MPCVIAIRRVFLPMQAYDFSCPVGHVVEGVGVRACDTVAEQVVWIIQILLHIPPEAAVKRPPTTRNRSHQGFFRSK